MKTELRRLRDAANALLAVIDPDDEPGGNAAGWAFAIVGLLGIVVGFAFFTGMIG